METHFQISIIIPVYNTKEYLSACLDSVFAQTEKNLEFLAIDDASTDSSPAILEAYAAKDQRLRLLHCPGQGAGAARNVGLEQARGDYLCFLDSDDLMLPDLCEKTWSAAKKADADICLYGGLSFDSGSGAPCAMPHLLRSDLIPDRDPFSPADLGTHLFQITSPCPWTKLIRREFILQKGLRFQTLQRANDLFFVYSGLYQAERITALDQPLIRYRTGTKSSLQSTTQQTPLDFYTALCTFHTKLCHESASPEILQSFVNAAIDISAYNLASAGNEKSKELIFTTLQEQGLKELNLSGHPAAYYQYPFYTQVLKILENGAIQDFDILLANNRAQSSLPERIKKWVHHLF